MASALAAVAASLLPPDIAPAPAAKPAATANVPKKLKSKPAAPAAAKSFGSALPNSPSARGGAALQQASPSPATKPPVSRHPVGATVSAVAARLEQEIALVTPLLHKNHNQQRRTLYWRSFTHLHALSRHLAAALGSLRDSDYERVQLSASDTAASSSSTATGGSGGSGGSGGPAALTFVAPRRTDTATYTAASSRLAAAHAACSRFMAVAPHLCTQLVAHQQGAGFAGLVAVLVASAAVYVSCAGDAERALGAHLATAAAEAAAAAPGGAKWTAMADSELFMEDVGSGQVAAATAVAAESHTSAASATAAAAPAAAAGDGIDEAVPPAAKKQRVEGGEALKKKEKKAKAGLKSASSASVAIGSLDFFT